MLLLKNKKYISKDTGEIVTLIDHTDDYVIYDWFELRVVKFEDFAGEYQLFTNVNIAEDLIKWRETTDNIEIVNKIDEILGNASNENG